MKKIFYLGLIIHILLLTTGCSNDNNDEEIIELLPQITEQEERERVEQEERERAEQDKELDQEPSTGDPRKDEINRFKRIVN